MYVTNQDSNIVSIIDTTINTLIDTITVGPNPIGIDYDPVKHRMYVANSNFASPGNATVSVINLCECSPFDEGPDSDGSVGSIFQAQGSLLQGNSLTTNAKPEAEIPTFSENIKSSSNSQQQNQNSIGSITEENNNDQSKDLSQYQMQQEQLEKIKQLLASRR